MPVLRRDFPSQAALIEALTLVMADVVRQAVGLNGQAGLIVSGGRTPADLFTALSTQALPWDHTVVTLADERWVPPDDPASNEALVRRTLLTGQATATRFVPLYSGAATPEAGVVATAAMLSALPWPADLVLLGMGDDGHTASLFPGAPELDSGLTGEAICLAVNPPGALPPRLSLSVAALLNSRRIVVLITGAGKRTVLETALEDGPIADMPIRAILRQERVPVEIFWAP